MWLKARAVRRLQLRNSLSWLVDSRNATLNDQARHLCLADVHVCLCGRFQKARFCNLQGSTRLSVTPVLHPEERRCLESFIMPAGAEYCVV